MATTTAIATCRSGDGIVAEPVPHRIHRLVDLATGGAGTAEQVALENLAGLDEIMGADADQAEGTPVGLAGEERLGGPEHLLGRLRGVLQVAGAGDGAEVRGLELERDAFAGDAGCLYAPRHRLGELPQDWTQLLQVGYVFVEGNLRGHALGFAVGVDRAVVLAPGAQRQPFADLAVTGDKLCLLDAGQFADQRDAVPGEALPHSWAHSPQQPDRLV